MSTIPGTFADRRAAAIRWRRVDDAPVGRRYEAIISDGVLRAVLSQDHVTVNGIIRPLWHLSISCSYSDGTPNRCPTWDEMKHAKFQLVPADVAMVLIFPRKTAPYVNDHPTTLHLWESTDPDIDVN